FFKKPSSSHLSDLNHIRSSFFQNMGL
ncbi:hypothetical protein A2U01_0060835, partial [Trifolium medium]|nr:hypothetical protein [Trifolium medium]